MNSPFEDFSVDTFIQYHKKAVGSVNGALDPDCIDELAKQNCDTQAVPITAGCYVPPDGGTPFTVVTVYFVSSNALFGLGSSTADPYECCPIPELDPVNGPFIIAYEFEILCDCPGESTSRMLRQVPADAKKMWLDFVGTGH